MLLNFSSKKLFTKINMKISVFCTKHSRSTVHIINLFAKEEINNLSINSITCEDEELDGLFTNKNLTLIESVSKNIGYLNNSPPIR